MDTLILDYSVFRFILIVFVTAVFFYTLFYIIRLFFDSTWD